MLCFTQLGYRDVAVTGWDKVERQGSTRLSNAVINLLLFFCFLIAHELSGWGFLRGALLARSVAPSDVRGLEFAAAFQRQKK